MRECFTSQDCLFLYRKYYEWLATLTHVFRADTVERAYQISESHKQTDVFYKASFEGRFPWKGEVIILKNSEPQIM